MKLTRLLEGAGAKIGGAVVKEALKLIPGGNLVLVGAELAGIAIETTLEEVTNRDLSSRETARVAYSASVVISKIAKKLNNGESLRSDNAFFTNNGVQNSNAEELFEGVLLQCKRAHEEKKIRYISNIMANIAFDEDFGISEANQLLKLAENMTYRQLVYIAVINENELSSQNLRTNKLTSPDFRDVLAHQELLELINLGVINQVMIDDQHMEITPEYLHDCVLDERYNSIFSWEEVLPGALVLSPTLGVIVNSVMDLDEIEDTDIKEAINFLS